MIRAAATWVLLVAVAAAESRGQGTELPSSRLSVFRAGVWQEFWNSSAAPGMWFGPDPALTGAIQWRRTANGAEWAEVRLAGTGEAWRVRLIVARVDPSGVRFVLDTAYTRGYERPNWSIEKAKRNAILAINAGQFPTTLPWGWVVLNGREYLPPRVGPASTGVVFDSAGAVRWISGATLGDPAARRGVATAFQSYPTLLAHDSIPAYLRRAGDGVDVSHRDARAAIGQDSQGRVLLAITRFDGANGVLDFVPFGLTVPEMAAVMGALGARNAVMLDGGVSSQLLIREPGQTRRWRGLRKVPLGLVVVPR